MHSRRPRPPTAPALRGALRYLRIETPIILLAAFLINLTVICVFAEGFYGTGALRGGWAARAWLRVVGCWVPSPPPPPLAVRMHTLAISRLPSHAMPRRPADWAAGGR